MLSACCKHSNLPHSFSTYENFGLPNQLKGAGGVRLLIIYFSSICGAKGVRRVSCLAHAVNTVIYHTVFLLMKTLDYQTSLRGQVGSVCLSYTLVVYVVLKVSDEFHSNWFNLSM